MSQPNLLLDECYRSIRKTCSDRTNPSGAIGAEDSSGCFAGQTADYAHLSLVETELLDASTSSVQARTTGLQTPGPFVFCRWGVLPAWPIEIVVRVLEMRGEVHVWNEIEDTSSSDWSWLVNAISLHQAGKIDRSLDVVYNYIDDLLLDSSFNVVNQLLAELPAELPLDLLLGILTVTLPASDHLPARKGFFDSAKHYLEKRGHLEDGILDGLEG